MSNPVIVVLDGHTMNPGDNPWDGLAALGQLTVHARTAPGDFMERAREADVLLTNKTPITRAQIEELPELKFISVLATGYNIIDVAAARERGIPVSNVPAYSTDSVAQHTFALILELADSVGEHSRSVVAGDWSRCADFSYWKKPLIELSGLSLGVVGLGRIGRRAAEIGHAFGMRILYAGRAAKDTGALPATFVPMERLFAEADVVTLHCGQTAENLRFVNRSLLERMKPSAFLINTARGTLIDEADLAQALREGRLAGAALDVLSTEPPDAGNPLLSAPNCYITPHVSWSALAARKRLMETTVKNVRGFLEGEVVNQVNAG